MCRYTDDIVMVYKLNMSDGVIEFVKNRGRTFLAADDASSALRAARDLFSQMRNEKVQSLGSGKFLITFQISLDYHLSLLRSVEKSVKLLRSKDIYKKGRYLDRYAVATVFMETGIPEYLDDLDIKEEISSLRKAAVVSREVPNVMNFADYDICIYNYLEINSKEGFKSRVFRKVMK